MNFRRIGFIAGRGGVDCGSSIPFFREAPAGRATVSMTEVVDINLGSLMSPFWIFFCDADRPLVVPAKGTGLDGKVYATGVEFPDMGGVATLLWLANGTGEALADEVPRAGLSGKDGRGESAGDIDALF